MNTQITDIFLIKTKTDNIIQTQSIDETIFSKSFKKTSVINQKIYIQKNLYLNIDTNKKTRKYECIEYADSEIINELLCVKFNIKEIPHYFFPLINKYDDIIIRTINVYNNNIHIITDKYEKSQEVLTFIKLYNNDNIDAILNAILKLLNQY